ncbi:MAG: single-stranded DNA-binding protein [Lachnospiraceae bacterium]|nr:single-stranded DNA-binding protein [Lachnospiraceae bacterium]
MSRNNTIGIVGHIKTPPELIVEAADWTREVYETTLTRTRPSETEDTYILQFDGRAAGSKEMLEKITAGAEVLVGGEIRSENVHDPKPEESRVKVYIYAEVIAVNDPPVNDQNEVTICGNICKPPRFRSTRRRTQRGKRVAATSIMVAVNSPTGTNYIPCVCFGWQAFKANTLEVGDYVEIYGRFQSRDYKKRIEGRKLPYLSTVYEVCAIKFKGESAKDKDTKPDKEGRADT